ncbi:pyridoxal 5'-phosphate synthase glutaminase subunit PdxT [Rubeoparvulum massiliense]|uniref:pyridoxal 5'-phosphate synthase glutaminase subunit PdxT n=1 Tax=Rubeoparvulum massiliense TaxID=1631346 RepID=UPI00065DDE22|nr:pyridoxal 5'-phosphate synthase glutaminase subunit PdxT [Rubeoparvulum massiliense]
MDRVKIGVLALQGAVSEHIEMLNQAGAKGVPIKRVEELANVEGLIIPGGESTTIGKLIKLYGFDKAITQFYEEGHPIFGTCAGLILLAKEIEGQDWVHLGLMDTYVARNGFGRQKESFEVKLAIQGIADDFQAVFIRAPYIISVGNEANVLAKFDNKIVAAEEGRLLVAAFHPELTDDPRFHEYFVQMVKRVNKELA